MFKNINGVRLREYSSTYNEDLPKKFEIEYKDETLLNQIIYLDIEEVITSNQKAFWMFIIKNSDFKENKYLYGKVASEIYNKIINYLIAVYNFELEMILIDHVSNVYKR